MEDKKTYILESVGQMYLKYGIRSVTMDDVARELGLSKKTLYQYFSDKATLVKETLRHFMQFGMQLEKELKDLNAVDQMLVLREHWLKMLRTYNNNLDFDLKRMYPDIYARLLQVKKERIYAQTEKILEQGVAEGFFRKELNVPVISKLQVGRILLIFNADNKIYTEEELRSQGLLDAVLDYHIHAICTEKGLTYFKQQLNNVQNEE